jgi:hypothetical protein
VTCADGKGRLVAGLVVLGAAFVKCGQALMEEVVGPFASRGEGYEAQAPVASKARVGDRVWWRWRPPGKFFRADEDWVRR